MKSQTTKIQAAAALAVILAGSYTFAQSSSVSAPAASAATTSSTSVSELKPATKKVGAMFISNGIMSSADIDANGAGNAGFATENSLGLTYKVNPKVSLEAFHNFAYSFQRESIADNTLGYRDDAYIQRSPMLAVGYKSDQVIANSDPIAYKTKFYIGNDRLNKSMERLAVLRLDASTTWNLNTLVSIDTLVSPRIGFYSKDAANGNKSRLQLVVGPSANLNFSDKFNTYYSPQLNLKTFDAINGGELHFEVTNAIQHEVGFNYTIGPVTINPAYATTVDLNNGTGFQQVESTEYDLNIIAVF